MNNEKMDWEKVVFVGIVMSFILKMIGEIYFELVKYIYIDSDKLVKDKYIYYIIIILSVFMSFVIAKFTTSGLLKKILLTLNIQQMPTSFESDIFNKKGLYIRVYYDDSKIMYFGRVSNADSEYHHIQLRDYVAYSIDYLKDGVNNSDEQFEEDVYYTKIDEVTDDSISESVILDLSSAKRVVICRVEDNKDQNQIIRRKFINTLSIYVSLMGVIACCFIFFGAIILRWFNIYILKEWVLWVYILLPIISLVLYMIIIYMKKNHPSQDIEKKDIEENVIEKKARNNKSQKHK